MCQGTECAAYLEVWKSILMKKNDMSDDWFNKHILINKTSIDSWKDGRTFRVEFQLQNEWAALNVVNQFIIEINDTGVPYPSLQLPPHQLLTEAEIERALSLRAHSPLIHPINCKQKLAFDNKEQALDYFKLKTGVHSLKFRRLELERNLLLQPSDGHFFLRAFSVYDEKSNACFDSELDLQEERGYRIEGDTLSCF